MRRDRRHLVTVQQSERKKRTADLPSHRNAHTDFAFILCFGRLLPNGPSLTIVRVFRTHCCAVIVAACAYPVLAPSRAQQDQPIESVFRSGVEIVRAEITQNGRDRAPKRLVKEDFAIKQNGVVQSIDVFEVFVLSPTRICYEIGFSSTTPASVKTRTVEIRIRGYSKRIKSTYTLKDEGSRQSGSCKPA